MIQHHDITVIQHIYSDILEIVGHLLHDVTLAQGVSRKKPLCLRLVFLKSRILSHGARETRAKFWKDIRSFLKID